MLDYLSNFDRVEVYPLLDDLLLAKLLPASLFQDSTLACRRRGQKKQLLVGELPQREVAQEGFRAALEIPAIASRAQEGSPVQVPKIVLFRIRDKAQVPKAITRSQTVRGPQFTPQKSGAWLLGGVMQGLPFLLFTKPSEDQLIDRTPLKIRAISVYGRELSQLAHAGYRLDRATPEESAGCPDDLFILRPPEDIAHRQSALLPRLWRAPDRVFLREPLFRHPQTGVPVSFWDIQAALEAGVTALEQGDKPLALLDVPAARASLATPPRGASALPRGSMPAARHAPPRANRPTPGPRVPPSPPARELFSPKSAVHGHANTRLPARHAAQAAPSLKRSPTTTAGPSSVKLPKPAAGAPPARPAVVQLAPTVAGAQFAQQRRAAGSSAVAGSGTPAPRMATGQLPPPVHARETAPRQVPTASSAASLKRSLAGPTPPLKKSREKEAMSGPVRMVLPSHESASNGRPSTAPALARGRAAQPRERV